MPSEKKPRCPYCIFEAEFRAMRVLEMGARFVSTAAISYSPRTVRSGALVRDVWKFIFHSRRSGFSQYNPGWLVARYSHCMQSESPFILWRSDPAPPLHLHTEAS
jgi:hypothetical protein